MKSFQDVEEEGMLERPSRSTCDYEYKGKRKEIEPVITINVSTVKE